MFGRGVLTLRPTTVGEAIEVATPANSPTNATLNIENDEIQAFATGFSRIVIGHQDGTHAAALAGVVRIGAINAADQATFRDPLEVYGGSITVEDYSSATYTLRVAGDLRLDAVTDITLRNQVEARSTGGLDDIVLYAAQGAITQANVSDDGALAEPLRAAHLDAHAATGISLLYTELTSVSADNTAAAPARW